MSFFLTQNEMDNAYVAIADYLTSLSVNSDASPAAVDGWQNILVDTSGGPIVLTLEDPATAPRLYAPRIVNVGTNSLTINATINGVASPQILTQWGGMELVINNGQYTTAIKAVP